MKIVLLGSGNVATHLGMALKDAGHEMLQVWSRKIESASELANLLKCEATDDMNSLSNQGEIYILSVTDDAIASLAAAFPLPEKLLVHTSGTTDIEALGSTAAARGVFYPVQTFSKRKAVCFDSIPIAIEGDSPATEATLLLLAKSISRKVEVLDSQKRRALHVAAVFACNFSNHLYAIASGVLKENGLQFELLLPLILETADKIQTFDPEKAQTGPAVRGDGRTISKHLNFLKDKPGLLKIYELLSQDIINLHEKH